MQDSIRKADILIEARPYLQAFRGKVIVAKYGGSAIDNPTAMRGILEDLVFLSVVGIRAVLVHGGGPAIARKLDSLGKQSRFVDGMRVTDRFTLRVVNKTLEEINRRLVSQIHQLAGEAEGLTPKQEVIVAEPHLRAGELGYVGSVAWVHTGSIRRVFARQAIAVISPVGVGNGQLYNVNADDVASEVAASLKAEKLVLLTNVRGILSKPADSGSLLSTLSVRKVTQLIQKGTIQAGMIPKVNACVEALRRGVKKTHIIDAALPHAMLLEIFTQRGIGTEIIR